MRQLKLAIVFLCILHFTLAFATPYNTPAIDGSIAISESDWDADELAANDSIGDSPWGTTNDFDDIYLTWDANNLYIGLKFTVNNNTTVLYIETGLDGGVIDFNSTRGYAGAYARNITFPSDVGIDLIIANWNGSIPNIYSTADSNSVEISSSCIRATGGTYRQEIAIPWTQIYPDAINTVLPNASLSLVGVICGGDDYGAADAVPDNPGVDGGEGPHLLTEYVTINIDANGDGVPDFSGESVSGAVTFNDTSVSEPYPPVTISAYVHNTGAFFDNAVSVGDGSYLLAGLEIGTGYDFIASANGFIPDTVESVVIVSGENTVNFELEPYLGLIFGAITPNDFFTIIYATQDSEIIGFGDTTEIGNGNYRITHLPNGLYSIVVDPSSSDYIGQIIEDIAVSQDSAMELNITLERAGVIREVDDTIGDDYGPGWFTYPTEPVFVESAFDIEFVKIRDIPTEGEYQFEIGIGDIPDESVVDWNPYYPPLNLQKFDIYIDCHSGGAKVGLPNRDVAFVASDAWDFAISADGWWTGLLASNGQDIFSNFTQNVSAVTIETDTISNRVFVNVKKSAFDDHLGQADTTEFAQWDIIVLMLGHDGSGVEGIRYVNSGTSNQWNFNNGADGDIDPNVLDLLAMPGTDAFGNPKEPGRTQEEMLDYTLESPVRLEAAKSIDISPPTIEWTIPDSICHLSGTQGVYMEVNIDDDVGVVHSYLHWRNIGEADWQTPIPLGFRELTNSFVGDLPFNDINSDSFQFFFEARDSAGNFTYNPKEYADTVEPTIPNYPYSTHSANPMRIVPCISSKWSSDFSIPVNTFIGEKIIEFVDGTCFILNRDDLPIGIDTVLMQLMTGDTTGIYPFAIKSPDLEWQEQYRELKIYSENELQIDFIEPPTMSFHYFESADNPFNANDEDNFVIAELNFIADIWTSLGGRNDISANTIDSKIRSDTASFFGLFKATNLSPKNEPISQIIISPNPFSPNNDGNYDKTNITFDLKYDGRIDADIFDLNGTKIKQLAKNQQVYQGRNENIIWDGKDEKEKNQPMGIYLLSARLTYVLDVNERIFRKNVAIVIVR